MKENTIYKSPEGEAQILRLYDKALANLGIAYEDKYVDTRFGKTHFVVCGRADAPALLLFHGGNSTTPHGLKWFFKSLADKYRIFAPDTIGHPGKSAQVRLNPRDASYGEWASDIISELKTGPLPVIGPSYGGGILIRLAAYDPAKISKAVLVVPSGLVLGSAFRMVFEVMLPVLAFRRNPTREKLLAACSSWGPELDDEDLELIGAVFKHLKIESSFPKLATKKELERFTAPTLVIAAEDDIFFPGKRVIERARKVIPNLTGQLLLDSIHFMPSEKAKTAVAKIVEFLEEEDATTG
ncbi:alpha/beta hydrolase [candidate division WOR-3 bacterium]|nr:alpha/beta hydrolase [candidate division WOR-3 bacterium]